MLPTAKRKAIEFMAILAMLLGLTAATADLCTVLNGITRKPLTSTVDGFSYDSFFFDLKQWITSQHCESSQTQVQWNSDPVTNNEIVYSSNGATGKGATVQYSLTASTSGDPFTVVATITLQMTLTKGGKSSPATATFGFDVRGIVTDLAGRFPPTWQGSLKTTSTSGLGVFDDDLFDGAGAFVVDEVSSGTQPSSTELKEAEDIARLAAEVNQRFRNFEPIPTALAGDVTARLAFPPTSIIKSITSSDVHLNGTSGFVASAYGECRGNDCGEDAVRTLAQLAGAGTACATPSLMADSVYGSLHATVGVENGKNVYILGVRATIHAVFACSGGFIGISLCSIADQDSAADNNMFSLRLFKEDTHAAISQVKSIDMQVLGHRYGYLTSGGSISTPVETDIFGYGRGGAFFSDVAITDSVLTTFQNAVSSIATQLRGDYPCVNDVFSAMCIPASTTEVLTHYLAQSAHPTSYGLWSYWAEQFNGFAIARGSDDKLLLEINSHIHSLYDYSAEDPSAVAFNSVLSSVNSKVKEACGSSCSSMTNVPTLNANAIKDAKIDIAVSATISIPTLSLSSDKEVSNNAIQQIKVVRHENALNGPEDVHMEFVAHLTADLSDQGTTLDEVNLAYSSVLGKAIMIKGALMNTVTGVAQPVGCGANGETFFNTNIDASVLPSFAQNFRSVANSVAGKESMTLPSLTQLTDHSTSQSLSEFMDSVASSLPTSGSMPVMTYFDTLRSLLEDNLSSLGLIPFLSLYYGSGSVSVDLTFVTVRRIGFEAKGPYWTKNVPVSRTELTLPLSTLVSFDFGTSASLNTYHMQGYSHAEGFSLPIREGMRVGLATAGFAETVINVPSYSYLTVSFSGTMERGSTFSGVFRGNMSTNTEMDFEDLFSFSMEEDNRGGYAQQADPSATLAALGDNFLFPSAIAQHQLQNKLAPIDKPIQDIVDLDASWKERTTWIYSSEAFPYVFVQSVSFPFSGFVETVNITVNNDYKFKNCAFNIPSASDVDSLVKSMSSAVSLCGDLSSFVRVGYSAGSDSDYSIIMSPIYAGSIYKFIVTAPNTSRSLMRSQSWSASRVTPDHLSWNDLYNGVYLALLKPTPSYSYADPVYKPINVAEAKLVNASRAQFYPTEIPGVFFNAAVKYHNPPKKIPIDPDFDTRDKNVSIEIDTNNAIVEGDISMSMTFGMAFWCSLGDGVLPFHTSFTTDAGKRYNEVTVPASPDNTFTFTATAEKRLASAVSSTPELVTFSQTITLTAGKLLVDALAEEVTGQLSGMAANMLSVERRVDSVYSQHVQDVLLFSPYQPDSNTLYVPLELTIQPTKIPCFGSSNSLSQVKAMTSCPLSQNYKIDINIHSSPNVDNEPDSIGLGDTVSCSGSMGVTEISSCSAEMVINYTFSIEAAEDITLLGHLHNAIPDVDIFPKWFKNVATSNNVLTVNNMTFDVDDNKMKTLSSESVLITKKESLPFSNLTRATETVYDIDIPSSTPTGHALASLSATNKKTFCSGLKQSLEKVQNFATADEMQQVLPFTNQKMAPIYSTLINDRLEDAMNSVCDVTTDSATTLDSFCYELKSKFGFEVCGDVTLSDDGLSVPLLIRPAMVYAPAAFQFDSHRIINNSTLSTALGNSGDLLLDTKVSADIGLNLKFLQRDDTEYYAEAVLDPKTTEFTSKVSLDSAPRVRTLLGSTVVTFDSQALNLDVAISGGISDGVEGVSVGLDGSARLDAHAENEDSSYYCHVTADVPVVQHYFYPPVNAFEDTVTFSDNCLQGDFVTGVENSYDNMTLAHYFEQDPDNFFKQFYEGLVKPLFEYMYNYVTDRAIAYIGKHIQELCGKVFDKIVGPEVASRIGDEITDMVTQLIKSGKYPDPAELERVVLTFFTGILNRIFGPYLKSPIPDPEPGDVITWQFRFGNTTTLQLKSIDWSCGDHGVADLEVKSDNQLIMNWDIDFDVVWNKTAGISIAWPVNPAMDAYVRLEGNGLDMSGSILFLNADLNGALSLQGELSGNPFQKDINFQVDAHLDGTAKLGLVDKIRQETKGEKANALGALPYVMAGLHAYWQFNWGTQNPKPTMPKGFQFTEPNLCLGSIITEFMQQVCREVNKVIEPLDPVFGPDGILQKPIPGLDEILGEHCNVLSILEWTCMMFSDSCNVKTVRKLIEVLNEIAADIGKIKEFMNYMQDPEGCMDFAYIYRTFNISWDKDDPTPDDPDSGNGIIPMTPTEKFYDSVPESERQPLREIMAKWAPSSTSVIRSDCVNCTEADAVTVGDDPNNKFGFKLDILEDFPQKLITILLGGNVALFSVSFPSASMSYSISWSIPVWDEPYIAVNIHASASLSFQPPSIALMSNAIVDTVKTGNPSHLFRNLAVSTTTPFASGTLEVDGGAEAGVNVVIAKVTVNFDITVKFTVEARVANFNNDDWATFDTIYMQIQTYGFSGAIQFRLELRGGFKLYLQACAKILFVDHCKVLAQYSWDTTLWSLEPSNQLITHLSDQNGNINGDSFDFSYPNNPSTLGDQLRTYIVTNTGIMFMPSNIQEGNAALTYNLASTYAVGFSSIPCSAEYNVVIDGEIRRPSMTMPSCSMVHITIMQMGYRTVDQYDISGTQITPGGRNPISFSQCASLSLEQPVYGTQYVLSGSPSCPMTIDTEYGSTLNLTGSRSKYSGSVTITGALHTIYAALTCNNMTIAATSIKCDDFTFTIPEGVSVITVTPINPTPHPDPHPEPQPIPVNETMNITIKDVPADRSVQIVGATPLVSVTVPQMKGVGGYVSIVGNTADDNYMHIDMDTPEDKDVVATAYPSHLSYNDSDNSDTHVIRHANVNVRSYSMKAAAGRKSTMRLIAPTSYEFVSVDMLGAKNSVLRSEVGGCDKRSMVNVSMNDLGTHTLVLGVDGTLKDLQCSLRVFTDGIDNGDDSVREIIVNASLDERQLNWAFSDSEFSVSNSLDTSDIFHVYTTGLDHVTVYFSQKNSNQLTIDKSEDDGTEYMFVFPEESQSPTKGFSSVQISETHSPVLMTGPVPSLILGDPSGSVAPFSKIGAVVVAPSGSNIILNSEATNTASHFSISENCVVEKQSASVPKPSDWFVNAIEELGIEYKEGCNLLVPNVNSQNSGFSTTLDISTGSSADSLEATNPACHVVANMGDGDDSVTWMSPDSSSQLFVQMGDGSDTLTVQSAGPVNVDLGEDNQLDKITVVCKDVSPSIVHSSVFPIGVGSADVRLEISHWDSSDVVEVVRNSLVTPTERATATIASDVEGAQIKYQQNDNTKYSVKLCTSKSSISFTSKCDGLDHAQNATVEVALDSFDNECTVSVDGAPKTNSGVSLGVDSNAQIVPSEMTLSAGSAVYGNLNVKLTDVDHLSVEISPAYSDSGVLTISGAPVKQDVFVNLPSWTTVVGENVKDIAIMTVFSDAEIQNFDVNGNGIMICLSSQDNSKQLAVKGNAMKDITMTRGCVEAHNKRILSAWLISQAKHAGFELDSEMKCAGLLKGMHFLNVESTSVKTARLSGLGWSSVRAVSLSESVDTIIIEDTNTESEDSLWMGATINDNDLMISKKNDDAFHVTMNKRSGDVSVGSAVFAPSAKFIVNCTDSSYHYNWNIALSDYDAPVDAEAAAIESSLAHRYYTDVTFNSGGRTCSGRISNNVFASMDTAPTVHLVPGLSASVVVETSGTKNAEVVERYVNFSYVDGMNHLNLKPFDHSYDVAEFVWDASLSDKTFVRLTDRSENSIDVSPLATSKYPLYLTTGVHSAVSFPNIGNNSISFEGVKAEHFNSATKSFDLLGGNSESKDIFCFNAFDMCSEDTWKEVRVLGEPCSIQHTKTSTCSKAANIHVQQGSVSALLTVSCGMADWDPSKYYQNPIAFNENGAEGEYANVIPNSCKIIAAILVIVAGGATVIGASVLLSRISVAISNTKLAGINRWWLANMMRDFFNDQFSWASIALTACLAAVSNYDISNWGGPVDGLVLQVKSFVFDWLNYCESVYSPVLIISWLLAAAALTLRIITGVAEYKDTLRWRQMLPILKPVHTVVSCITLLLVPFAGYATPVIMGIDVFAGIVTLIAALAIIASVPMDKFSSVTGTRVVSSYIAISVPFVAALAAGIGASRAVLLSILIICAIVMPLCNTFVLWKLFFAGADTRTNAWKHSLVWSFGLRAASLICGVIFLSTLFFKLNSTASGIAYAFWFLWIVLPPCQLIPLVLGTKFSNIVPRNYRSSGYYGSINSGETTPLRSGAPSQASLNTVGNLPEIASA